MIREAIREEFKILRRSAKRRGTYTALDNAEREAYWREVAALDVFDVVAEDLDEDHDQADYGKYTLHVLLRAFRAVNGFAQAHGGAGRLSAPIY